MAKKKETPEDFIKDAGAKEIKPVQGIPPWGWALVAVICALGIFGTITTTRKLSTCPYELKAVYALRALSNVELAYRDFNIENRFATLDGLKAHGFIEYGYLETEICPGYRVEITPFSLYDDKIHSFVIRIFPISKTRPCRTFQMGPDRKLQEFVPMVDSNPHKSENWIDASYILKQLPERDRLPWMGETYAYN